MVCTKKPTTPLFAFLVALLLVSNLAVASAQDQSAA